MDVVATFRVEYTQFLNPQGDATQSLPDFARDPAALLPLYRAMVRTRLFDAKAITLQRTGKLGTFASSLGQEAIGVGVASAIREEDVLLPYYRDHAAQFLRGVTIVECCYWGGDERGSDFSGPRQDFPNCVPIGNQVCHAVGVAYAFKLRREARVTVCIIGDGGTSKGDFYEAMNLAGVWRAPVVFVINNNQWAISAPRNIQTAAQTLAQKGIAAGIEVRQVDGNDVIAVRHVIQEAVEKARAGDGPTLIEAISYRLGITRPPTMRRAIATRPRSATWALEPIARLRNYLVRAQAWDKDQEDCLLKECSEAINQAVDDYLAVPAPHTEAMFDHLYAMLPDTMREQRATALRFAPTIGECHG